MGFQLESEGWIVSRKNELMMVEEKIKEKAQKNAPMGHSEKAAVRNSSGIKKSKIYSPGYRKRKAYWTAFRVLISYLSLSLRGKLFGKGYYEKRISRLHIKNANRVKDAILKLNGLFIKIGQLLSNLSNLVPEEFQAPLEALQDRIAARPFAEAELTLKESLAQPYSAIFSKIDKEPIASASIGQVHRAQLMNGKVVAVKIQHRHIKQIAAIDLKIMERLVALMSKFYRIKGMDYAYAQVETMIREELDFTKEAKSMQTIAENLIATEDIKVPQVYEAYSTDRILTTEFVEGVKINQVGQLKAWGLDPKNIGERIIEAYCKMVFIDGLYHADPHPGNIMVQADGTIVFLDFGAVGQLKPSTRRGLLDLIEGAVKNDEYAILKAMQGMGFLGESREAEKMAQKMIVAFQHFIQNEVEFDGLNFKDLKVNAFDTSLFKLMNDIGIRGITSTVQIPKEYVLLNRMVTLLLGICNTLDSSINPITVVKPYFKKFLIGDKGVVEFFTTLLKSTATQLISIPGDVSTFLKKANSGQLSFHSEEEVIKNKTHYQLAQQFFLLLAIIANLGFCYWFYNNEDWGLLRIGKWSAVVLGVLYLRTWWLGRRNS